MPSDYIRFNQQQVGIPIYGKTITASTNIYASDLEPNKTPTVIEFWANMSVIGSFTIIKSIAGTQVAIELPSSAVGIKSE
jgi:hypothetical protein